VLVQRDEQPRDDEPWTAIAAPDEAPAPAAAPHRPRRGGGAHSQRRADHERGSHAIRGQLTLNQIAAETGLSVREIKAALNLPAHVGGHERLGRLRRRFGFDIEEARAVLNARAR
jgi:hypothetical protein